MSWTDERTAMLKQLCADGYSASQIAKELGGVSRNGVISKIHRMGFDWTSPSTWDGPLRGKIKVPRTPPRARKTRSAHISAWAAAHAKPQPASGASHVPQFTGGEAIDLSPEAITAQAVTMIELQEHHCRWPLGDPRLPDFRFCGGRKIEGHSYCGTHCRLAYSVLADRPLSLAAWWKRQAARKAA